MYDVLSQLFVLCFAGFYLIFFAVLVFWVVKPWLVPALKRRIVPIPRLVAERARVLRREADASAGMQSRETEPASNTQRLSSSERRLQF